MKPGVPARFTMLAATLLLAACATAPLAEYPSQHPASAEATQAPAPAAPGALAGYRPAPAAKETSVPSAAQESSGASGAQELSDAPKESDHERH